MDALYQRLKELDSDTFEKLCFHILKERHPGLEIQSVEGAAGDEGVDVFAGTLHEEPAIWQCKAFPNGIGNSQKDQIRKSLRAALKHFTPSYWILCLSVVMDIKTQRWFQRLQQSNEGKIKIGLFSAGDIVEELLHRRSIRHRFFPGLLDAIDLKRIATGTGELSSEQLEHTTNTALEESVERLKERDARFNYQIVFDGDLGPPAPHTTHVPAGLVMSILRGGKTINVFARDIKALQSNPPRFSTTLTGSGIKKVSDFIKTGVEQELEASEVVAIKSDWPLLSEVTKAGAQHTVKMSPSPLLRKRKRSVRVEFIAEDGGETIRYESLDLRPVRGGTEEVEFSLSGRNVPFKLSMVASIPTGDTSITFAFDERQPDAKAVKKMLDAMALLRPSGRLQFFDLELGKPILESVATLREETTREATRRAFINDVVAVSSQFGVDFELPERPTNADLETLYLLKAYMTNGTIELDNISFGIVKSEENKDLVPQQLASGKMSFGFENTNLEPLPKLFGQKIKTGPVIMTADVDINDLPATLQAFNDAPVGTAVQISTRPFNPVRVSLGKFSPGNLTSSNG